MHVIPARPVVVSLQPPPDPIERSLVRLGGAQSTARHVAAIAGGQGGCVARPQLLRLGFSRDVIAGWIAHGWLIPLHRGVYAVGHLPQTHVTRWWAAVLACGDQAKASCRVAAAAHALLRPHARLAVTAPSKRVRPGIAVHRGDVAAVYVDGLPCTTVAQTLVDLSGCVPYGVLESAVRQAQVRGVLDIDAIGIVTLTKPRPRGIRRLRAILEDPVALEPTRSGAERVALRELVAAGHPWPVVGGRIPVAGDLVDFHWPDRRVVLEIDGPTHATAVQRPATTAATRVCARTAGASYGFPKHTRTPRRKRLTACPSRSSGRLCGPEAHNRPLDAIPQRGAYDHLRAAGNIVLGSRSSPTHTRRQRRAPSP